MLIDRNITLKHNFTPSVADLASATPVEDARRHIIFTDKTSELFLNGCTFETTATGFAMDAGTLIISDQVDFNMTNGGGYSEPAEISAVADVKILAAAVFDINGPFKYVA